MSRKYENMIETGIITTAHSGAILKEVIKKAKEATRLLKERWPSMNKPTNPSHTAELDVDEYGNIYLNKHDK